MPASGRSRKPPSLLDANALWDYAVKSLGRRAMSSSELRQKLNRRAANAGDIDPVLGRMKDLGYINDAQFAESFATARRDTRGFGKMRVLRDLRIRRVAPALAEKAATDAYQDVDEAAAVQQYLERKYRGKNMAEFLSEEKNLAAAYRRLRYAGFSSGISIRVLKRFSSVADELENTPEEEDDKTT